MDAEKHWTEESLENMQFALTLDFVNQIEKIINAEGKLSNGPPLVPMDVDKIMPFKEMAWLSRELELKMTVLVYNDSKLGGSSLRGPIPGEVFYKCWEKCGKPRDMFELGETEDRSGL